MWAATKNPYTSHNVVFLLSFVIAFSGAYYLTRFLTGSQPAALVAAVLFAFCPYIFARTAHVQLLFTGGLPWCMLAFHQLVEAPSVRRSVVLGVVLWATALTCAYYGIFAGLMIGLGTLLFAFTRRLWRSIDYWVAIGLAAFISIGLTVPFFLPYIYVQREMGFTRTLDDARQYSADLGAWGASSAWSHRWWLPMLGDYREVLFPGVIVSVLALAAIVTGLAPRREPAAPSAPTTNRVSRDVTLLYLIIALLAFWSLVRPRCGSVSRVVRDAADLYLPASASTNGPHDHVRLECPRVGVVGDAVRSCEATAGQWPPRLPHWRWPNWPRCP